MEVRVPGVGRVVLTQEAIENEQFIAALADRIRSVPGVKEELECLRSNGSTTRHGGLRRILGRIARRRLPRFMMEAHGFVFDGEDITGCFVLPDLPPICQEEILYYEDRGRRLVRDDPAYPFPITLPFEQSQLPDTLHKWATGLATKLAKRWPSAYLELTVPADESGQKPCLRVVLKGVTPSGALTVAVQVLELMQECVAELVDS